MFKKGQTVYINEPRGTEHGKSATVVEVNASKEYAYLVQVQGDAFPFWRPASELSTGEENPRDFSHTGLGIGGLGSYVEDPIIPTVAQMERMERLERQDRRCRRCHQSETFDGAMFTTDARSGLCDDCYG